MKTGFKYVDGRNPNCGCLQGECEIQPAPEEHDICVECWKKRHGMEMPKADPCNSLATPHDDGVSKANCCFCGVVTLAGLIFKADAMHPDARCGGIHPGWCP